MVSLPSSESLTVEFKSDRKTMSENVIAEEVVALANTDGGKLYIGIEDDGEITGAQPVHRDPVRLAAMIANKTVPPISVRIELLGGELPVLQIEVPKSVSVVATTAGKILRRRLKVTGDPESVPMYPYEISTRLSDLGRLDYSAQPIPDSTRSDFDPVERERLRRVIGAYSSSDKSLLELSDEELEKALRLTVSVGGEDVPTLTGLLMIGEEASIERLVPTSEATFQVLQGTEIKVNETYKQPLLTTIERIMDALEPWNSVTEVPMGIFNDPVPTFDRRAVREAVVNAFGHRDYSVLGRVRVAIDDIGLTVSNPGGFIEGISVRNLLTAEPHGRNPCLMDALKRVGLAERTGRGIDRIFEGSLQYGRPIPDYADSDNTRVSLFIARSSPDMGFIQMLSEEKNRTGSPLSLPEMLVLDALRRMRRVTQEDLEGEIDVRTSRLKRTLEVLIESGLVEASGVGKNRTYLLSSKVYRRRGKAKEYVRQTDIDKVRYPELIMKLVERQGRITTSDVSELLHLDAHKAYYEIRKLAKDGKIKKAKNGPDAYYIAV